MVHCNNCTSDLNAWVNLFKEFMKFGIDVDMNKLYVTLYNAALEGEADCKITSLQLFLGRAYYRL